MKSLFHSLGSVGLSLIVLAGSGGCGRQVPTARFQPLEKIPWEDNLLLRDGVQLIASSHNLESERVDRLIDNDPYAFWHIDESQAGSPAGVEADFGEGGEVAVTSLAARPRQDKSGLVYGDQFFRNVQIQASTDGLNWQTVSRAVQSIPPDSPGWYRCDFDNLRPFRFWRLVILDGHSGPQAVFLSFADLALFR